MAACRGEAWARDVAELTGTGQPWPVGPKMMAIARRKVEDLAIDPKLREMLATELARWAARRWDALRDADVCTQP